MVYIYLRCVAQTGRDVLWFGRPSPLLGGVVRAELPPAFEPRSTRTITTDDVTDTKILDGASHFTPHAPVDTRKRTPDDLDILSDGGGLASHVSTSPAYHLSLPQEVIPSSGRLTGVLSNPVARGCHHRHPQPSPSPTHLASYLKLIMNHPPTPTSHRSSDPRSTQDQLSVRRDTSPPPQA
ncbi:hypothetical protein K474DRAFT_1709308 [Panus rudis PR-1116 ss-1]|nr:hypothetical protein K474DRAFT_1709308 [Panus rudis PR-1116 ss-1]